MRSWHTPLSAFILLSACSDSSGPSAPPYMVQVTQTAVRTGDGGEYLRDVSVRVTSAGEAVAGARVAFQLTAGSGAPLPLTADVSGDVDLTWAIPASQRIAGTTHSLGFCAHPTGASCSIDLNGNEVVRVTF
jgi:hypothetical protein